MVGFEPVLFLRRARPAITDEPPAEGRPSRLRAQGAAPCARAHPRICLLGLTASRRQGTSWGDDYPSRPANAMPIPWRFESRFRARRGAGPVWPSFAGRPRVRAPPASYGRSRFLLRAGPAHRPAPATGKRPPILRDWRRAPPAGVGVTGTDGRPRLIEHECAGLSLVSRLRVRRPVAWRFFRGGFFVF